MSVRLKDSNQTEEWLREAPGRQCFLYDHSLPPIGYGEGHIVSKDQLIGKNDQQWFDVLPGVCKINRRKDKKTCAY
jgi:hypothetical protein